MPRLLTLSPGPSVTAPTSTGTPTSRTASSIARRRRVVGVRVDVGGVLRPDDQVGLRSAGRPARPRPARASRARGCPGPRAAGRLEAVRAAGRCPAPPRRRTCGPLVGVGHSSPTATSIGPSSTAGRGRDTSATPTAATASVTSGAPPTAANGVSGVWPWLKASRPQGKPPNGSRSRRASSPTQSSADQSGQAFNRLTAASAEPRRARNSASSRARANHASGPAVDPDQTRSGTKKPRPCTSPSQAPTRSSCPRTTR